MRVDMHCHLAHPEYIRGFIRLAEQGDRVARPGQGFYRRANDPAIASVDLLLEQMERGGVDVAVLSMNPPSAFFDDRAAALDLAQIINDYYAELARKHPGRFWALACLPMLHADAALDELRRTIDGLGFQGVGLGGTIGGYALDDPRFAPIFEEINRRRLPVLVHPMRAPGDALFNDYGVNVTLGFVYDTSLGVMRFIMSGARDRYPDFPLIVTHLGGTLLFLQARLDDQSVWGSYAPPGPRPGAGGPPRPPSAYLAAMYYDTVSHHPPALRCCVDTVGADHLLLGSDYPWVWDAMPRAVELVEQSGLSDVQKEGILGLNAARVLGKEGAPRA